MFEAVKREDFNKKQGVGVGWGGRTGADAVVMVKATHHTLPRKPVVHCTFLLPPVRMAPLSWLT